MMRRKFRAEKAPDGTSKAAIVKPELDVLATEIETEFAWSVVLPPRDPFE